MNQEALGAHEFSLSSNQVLLYHVNEMMIDDVYSWLVDYPDRLKIQESLRQTRYFSGQGMEFINTVESLLIPYLDLQERNVRIESILRLEQAQIELTKRRVKNSLLQNNMREAVIEVSKLSGHQAVDVAVMLVDEGYEQMARLVFQLRGVEDPVETSDHAEYMPYYYALAYHWSAQGKAENIHTLALSLATTATDSVSLSFPERFQILHQARAIACQAGHIYFLTGYQDKSSALLHDMSANTIEHIENQCALLSLSFKYMTDQEFSSYAYSTLSFIERASKNFSREHDHKMRFLHVKLALARLAVQKKSADVFATAMGFDATGKKASLLADIGAMSSFSQFEYYAEVAEFFSAMNDQKRTEDLAQFLLRTYPQKKDLVHAALAQGYATHSYDKAIGEIEQIANRDTRLSARFASYKNLGTVWCEVWQWCMDAIDREIFEGNRTNDLVREYDPSVMAVQFAQRALAANDITTLISIADAEELEFHGLVRLAKSIQRYLSSH